VFVAAPALLPLTPEVLVTVPVLGKPLVGPMAVPLVGPMAVPPVGLMAVPLVGLMAVPLVWLMVVPLVGRMLPLVGLMVVPLVALVPLVVWAMAAVDASRSNAAATERIFRFFICHSLSRAVRRPRLSLARRWSSAAP
jgi:hypothetical protein